MTDLRIASAPVSFVVGKSSELSGPQHGCTGWPGADVVEMRQEYGFA